MSEMRNRSPVSATKDAYEKADGGLAPAPHSSKERNGTQLTRLLFIISTGLSLVYLAFFTRQQAPLPDAYALCSRDGQYIYTVDPVKPKVQCIVVQDSEIFDTGSIGMLEPYISCSPCSSSM